MGITLAGRPFFASSFLAAVERILHEASAAIHIFNPNVPEQLQPIAMEATAKAPEQRYANAFELLKDLRLVQAGVTHTEFALAAPMRPCEEC